MAHIDEDILWKAAEKLRNKCDPAQYKNIVLGLVFLKYVSDKYVAKRNELIKFHDGREDIDDYYIKDFVFIVPHKALWSEIAKSSKQPDLGQKIDEAFALIESKNYKLKGILSKIYSDSKLDKATLGELVDFFENNLKMEEADGDFFGQIYEYYLGKFSETVLTKGGEFFTPKSIVELMVDIIKPYKGRVYDPCCGSGGMFVQCSKFVKEHQGNVKNIHIFGQEINYDTWVMAKMNLAIRGLDGDLGTSHGDSFLEDMHKGTQMDYILANPPYNLKEFWKPQLEGDSRWVFGEPDRKNGNYAWLELMYSKLSNNGKAAILMPNGATTSGYSESSADYKVRKAMIESGKIAAIIALPNKLFSNVSISVQCWILDKAKTNTDVLFINADEMGKLIKRKIRVLEKEDQNKIIEAFDNFENNTIKDTPGFAKRATLNEIRKKDYSLSPGRYVGADESNKLSPEEIQEELRKTASELFELMKEGKELEDKVKKILEEEMR